MQAVRYMSLEQRGRLGLEMNMWEPSTYGGHGKPRDDEIVKGKMEGRKEKSKG